MTMFRRIGTLAFNHEFGDCVSVTDDRIYLCFNSETGDGKKCRVGSSPTGQFSEVAPSNYEHRVTRIATNNGECKQTTKSDIEFQM